MAEFVDSVGVAVLPKAMMDGLLLSEGDVAQFCRILMPTATKVVLSLRTFFTHSEGITRTCMHSLSNSLKSSRSLIPITHPPTHFLTLLPYLFLFAFLSSCHLSLL